MEKSRISPIAVQYGFKSLEVLPDSSYNVETSLVGLKTLNIKKLENSGYERNFLVSTKEEKVIFKVIFYPEEMMELKNLTSNEVKLLDVSFNNKQLYKDSSTESQVAKIMNYLEKHGWCIVYNSHRNYSGFNEMTYFGNNPKTLEGILHKKAKIVCESKKIKAGEFVILNSHNPKAKYYAFYRFKCE